MKKNVLNAPHLLELKKKRRRGFLNKILFFLFAFSVIFAGLAYLSRISILNIDLVEVTGNKIVDEKKIKATVEQEVAGKYLWFFPKTNVLYYPKNDIKKELQNRFKSLKNVTASIKNKRTLEISVTEREALYTWCGVTPAEIDVKEKKCYFVDEDGYIFEEAPYFSPEVYFKLYGLNDLNAENPSGSFFMKENFLNIVSFKQKLETMGLKPVALYEENENIRIFLSGRTNLKGPEIILETNSDFQKLAENLEVALNTEPLQSNFKNKYSSLVYIDLRFGDKVYYKFR